MRFKKDIWVLCAACVLIANIGCCLCACTAGEDNEYEGIIRFHVIANSDSDEDQALKLKVRDRVLKYINSGLTARIAEESEQSEEKVPLDISTTRDYINSNMPEIEEAAEQIIVEEGYDYKVSAELGVCHMPEKTYGDMVFPEGNYEALNITIGDGAGHNWWCVLFPPLCLIDTQGKDAIDGLGLDGYEGIKLKSKIAEIIAGNE